MTEATTDAIPSTSPAGWRRPAPGEHRSPCPALNSLANGGHLPRDGRVTAEPLVRALRVHFGLLPSIGGLLARAALKRLGKDGPDGVKMLDLADLAEHGFIEHDASLTRRDARKGDAVETVKPLLDQLLSLSADGKTLTRDDLAVAHQLRMAQSGEGGHRVPLKAALLGTLEAPHYSSRCSGGTEGSRSRMRKSSWSSSGSRRTSRRGSWAGARSWPAPR
jgi:hypothetical protein